MTEQELLSTLRSKRPVRTRTLRVMMLAYIRRVQTEAQQFESKIAHLELQLAQSNALAVRADAMYQRADAKIADAMRILSGPVTVPPAVTRQSDALHTTGHALLRRANS